MTKSIIMSVSPEEALNILNGKQTALLRKRIPKYYKGWVYGYVTKGKPYLINKDILSEFYELREKYLITYFDEDLNGTIPFRFWYDEYECYSDISGCTNNENGYECEFDFVYALHDYKDKLEELCLSYYEVEEYGNGKDLYVLKIDGLTIFDKPMQLNDFSVLRWKYIYLRFDCPPYSDQVFANLSTPPKTYQYVWVKEGE
jgi:predicted transcriptional regulator